MIALENLKELLAGIPVEPHHRHMIEVHIDAAGDVASDARDRISELLRFNNEFEGQARAARAALRIALGHIDHMTAWIALQKAGYSFESLGEDMPDLRAVLKRPYPEPMTALERAGRAIENLRRHQRQLDEDGVEVGVSRQALDEVLRAIGP